MKAPTLLASTAVFSPCRVWRYELWRRWSDAPYALFVGLNPSTADETRNDPTVTRCIRFAQAWGFGALCMSNIFAFRSTDPRCMKAEPDPIGAENSATLIRLAAGAGIVVAAWGAHGAHLGRGKWAATNLPRLQCLRKTKAGWPGHPLYLPKNSKPVPFP